MALYIKNVLKVGVSVARFQVLSQEKLMVNIKVGYIIQTMLDISNLYSL